MMAKVKRISYDKRIFDKSFIMNFQSNIYSKRLEGEETLFEIRKKNKARNILKLYFISIISILLFKSVSVLECLYSILQTMKIRENDRKPRKCVQWTF